MRRARPAALAACLLIAAPALADDLQPPRDAVREAEAQRIAIFERAARSVVCIFADRTRSGGGSGVIIDPAGYGLTNFHVVQEFVESRSGYGGLSDGRLYPLTLLGIDPGGDIAMFKLAGKEQFDAAPLGNSDPLRVGQWVAAMGNPFLVAEDFTPTITLGIISGLHRYQEGQGNLLEYADCIQVSTSINPGNSGGPLFDLTGRLLGINGRASFEERGRVNVGLGYAVTINQIKRFLPGLRAGRLLEHGTLGATLRAIDEKLLISVMQSFSPAETAGLKVGDEILGVAGRDLRTPNDYINILSTLPAGWPVTIRARREDRVFEARARLGRLPLRLPIVYLPDLEHNRTEIRLLLERYHRTSAPQLAPDVTSVTWVLRDESSDPAQRGSVSWFAGRTPAAAAPASPDDPGALPAEFEDEWLRLVTPLLADPPLGLEWELIEGDEVEGRVVHVLQRRRSSGRRARWKFDLETDRLLEIAFGDDTDFEQVRWRPGPPVAFDAMSWPQRWQRIDPRGQTAVYIVDELHATTLPPRGANE